MNSKMTTNSQPSAIEPKKQNKSQANNQNRNRITEMEITWRVIGREGKGTEWGKRFRE